MSTEAAAIGELRWNVKQSFRDYVAELPDGAETWTADVGGIVDGDLVFPATAVDAEESGGVTLKFAGAVRYQGYRGMLRVDLRDPWLVVDVDGGGSLTADVAPPGVGARRVAIAAVTVSVEESGGEWSWADAPTTLTSAGSSLLGDVYPAGTEAAGITLRVDRA